ncbi:hypothetical protein OVA29_13620 [Exiguobacterium sp. SL14]|nr:hypothetical protein [Exiguobacterium sp. SL14]MCY1691595.1 hypothetical protein [Exiguobacterium sp. SL14]
MKWIHTADWHLGKIVHGESMLENQRAVLADFLALVDREQYGCNCHCGGLIRPCRAADGSRRTT